MEGYFDLSAISAGQSKVGVVLGCELPRDWGDATPKGPAKGPGAVVEVPLWLAEGAAEGGGGGLGRVLPGSRYDEAFRDTAAADASVLDLHRHGPHYFRTGAQVARLEGGADSAGLGQHLVSLFVRRLPHLLQAATQPQPPQSFDRLEVGLHATAWASHEALRGVLGSAKQRHDTLNAPPVPQS